MGITSGIVLYAVIWFMTLFVMLPIGLSTQGDEGEIVPGTHAGSPARISMKRKAFWTTVWATLIWAVVASIIVWGGFTARDLDWFGRMTPLPSTDGSGG
ncbi:DUF1467 family protein [Oceaniovalibus guishaninsula]|uniref:DUF1467 family protein n=1 Tax=Oceaniovalibus guishaninsula TaxID=1046117 RepID=UPI0009FDD6BA|nr:DUF1467 family protein [Oceaniovalibus guishaninsula]